MKFLYFKLFLSILLGVGLWFSYEVTGVSIEVQKTQLLLESYQQGKTTEEELVAASRLLTKNNFSEHDNSVLKAEIMSLVYDRSSSGTQYALSDVITTYKKAISAKPYNSILWSKYAIYLSKSLTQRGQALFAIDQAERFGKNDYRTLKNLVYFGIREWPRLDCDYQNRMLRHIEAAFTKNDHILLQWNARNHHMAIGKYVSTLMEYYKFDEPWAKIQVQVCQQKLT